MTVREQLRDAQMALEFARKMKFNPVTVRELEQRVDALRRLVVGLPAKGD